MVINICDKDGYGIHIECTDVLTEEEIQKEHEKFSKNAKIDKEFARYLNDKYSDINARVIFHNPIFEKKWLLCLTTNCIRDLIINKELIDLKDVIYFKSLNNDMGETLLLQILCIRKDYKYENRKKKLLRH